MYCISILVLKAAQYCTVSNTVNIYTRISSIHKLHSVENKFKHKLSFLRVRNSSGSFTQWRTPRVLTHSNYGHVTVRAAQCRVPTETSASCHVQRRPRQAGRWEGRVHFSQWLCHKPQSRQSAKLFSRRRNWEWDSPNSSPAGDCAPPPPPFGFGGRGTLAGERGVGRVPIPRRGDTLWHSLYICTWCHKLCIVLVLFWPKTTQTVGFGKFGFQLAKPHVFLLNN
jgi:hypothetical protein